MNVASPFLAIFRALDAERVKYLVVGGVAVVLHGHLRFTADLDLVVALERDNVLAAMKALKALGYMPRAPVRHEDFADAETRKGWIEEKGMLVFSLWSALLPGLEVDIFTTEPIPFEEMLSTSRVACLEGVDVRLASLAHLLRMKRDAGRPQDLEDIRALERIRDLET